MTVNDEFSVFTAFCDLFDKAMVVPQLCKSVFLSGGPIKECEMDPTISTSSLESPSNDMLVKDQFDVGQRLSLVRDGHCESVTLESVHLDFDRMIPYFTVKLYFTPR